MVRRSLLFSPGDRPEMLRKAADTDADVLVFDLEDAVAPGRKPDAREAVREVLADPEFDPDQEVCVRVNVGDATGADLDAIAGTDPDSVMRPKTATAQEVETLARGLREHDVDAPVLALVETAAGVLHAEPIAAAPPTDALVFGAEDLAADLGATRTDAGSEVVTARQTVVLAAAAAGIDAIDTLHTDVEDDAGLRESARQGAEFGYDGMIAVHPRQVGPINEAYTPDPERVEWARRILDAAADADRSERGVFAVDGEMVDAPLVDQARTVVERARAAGVLDGSGDAPDGEG